MMNNEDSAYVLYVDHQGHPSPLSLCYHATASRRLSSSVDRPPLPSSITEVDSAYCPQCLSFQDANTAATANLGVCSKATCRLCPLCPSVSSVVVKDSVCFYECGRCNWNSKICGIETSLAIPNDDDNISLQQYEDASLKLFTQWKSLVEERNRPSEDHFSTMKDNLSELAKDHIKCLRSSSTPHFVSKSIIQTRKEDDFLKGLSIQSLEESQRTRKENLVSSFSQTVGNMKLERITLEAGENSGLFHPSFEGISTEIILSKVTGENSPGSLDTFLPRAIPLRPRKSRRCRAELAENRPGILLKPKLNPVEGDSSLRTGHGQWWKKDSSAIQVLPRVRCIIDASDGIRHAFLIKVSNPTLGVVRLRMAASSYSGERTWENASRTSPFLENIFVNPLTKKTIDAKLDTHISKRINTTELCELEAAEDSFFSNDSNGVPEVVCNWDASDSLLASKVSEENPVTLRKIGQKKSMVWFELILIEPPTKSYYSGLPLAMEIQVGDGSWESSLVQSETNDTKDCKDFVSFDLVLVWEMLD